MRVFTDTLHTGIIRIAEVTVITKAKENLGNVVKLLMKSNVSLKLMDLLS